MDATLVEEIKRYISTNDSASLIKAMHNYHLGIDDFLDTEKSETALSIAIKLKQKDMVAFLLQSGANPNLCVRSETLLILAILSDEPEIVKLLLDHGALSDVSDDNGNTPVALSIKRNQLLILTYLVKAGANLHAKDKFGKRPIDYIHSSTDQNLAIYLQHATLMQEKALHWPEYTDGPFVEWKDSSSFELKYFYTRDRRLCEKSELFHSVKLSFVLKSSILFHPVEIKRHYDRSPGICDMPERLLAIGDLHGNLQSLLSLMIGNKIIDAAFNWIWGNGQIVFIGDLFDRGCQVTELIWFVQHFESQAQINGGRVHLILGNHEIMALIGDHRYLNEKYRNICEYFSMNYWEFYTPDSELGRFIRSKPAILKIGDILFVHAGIGPELLSKMLSINEINDVIYNTLSDNKRKLNELEIFMLLDDGPLWFRDLLHEYSYFQTLSESYIDSVLSFYEVSHIIIGHSEIPEINSRYNGKVIAINVPFYHSMYTPQALLIECNQYFIIGADGEKKLFLK